MTDKKQLIDVLGKFLKGANPQAKATFYRIVAEHAKSNQLPGVTPSQGKLK